VTASTPNSVAFVNSNRIGISRTSTLPLSPAPLLPHGRPKGARAMAGINSAVGVIGRGA